MHPQRTTNKSALTLPNSNIDPETESWPSDRLLKRCEIKQAGLSLIVMEKTLTRIAVQVNRIILFMCFSILKVANDFYHLLILLGRATGEKGVTHHLPATHTFN